MSNAAPLLWWLCLGIQALAIPGALLPVLPGLALLPLGALLWIWAVGWSAGWPSLLLALVLLVLGWGAEALGLVLGLIPCGMIYAALAVAGAGHDPLAGATAMAAFGLGTAPALIGVGLAGHAAGSRFRPLANRVQPYLMMVSAFFLGALAIASA